MGVTVVEMEDVEVINLLEDSVELDLVVHAGIRGQTALAQGLGHAWAELGIGDGVAAGKQDHFMAAPYQFFGEVMNNPLGPPISNRWNPLMER